MPDEAKILIRKLLSIQRCNGSAMHQFNPLTMVGSEGDSLELEDRPHYYSDDHLWIVLAVTAYLKETGDFAFLDEDTPYYEKSRAGKPLESGSVLDHLRRAVAFTKQDVGAHGLPLLGYADWNDTVNLAKGAESLFTAHLYGKALLELIELMKILGDTTLAEAYKTDHEKMKGLVNQYAWDGAWYVRYFDFDGTPLGSKTNLNGQIYLNGQSWSILSGFATSDRGKQAMESVKQKLHTPKGIKLSTPGFNGFDPRHGGITTYPPGAKENGGIFLHPNPWAIIAETLLGNGDRAFMYYTQINPATKNEIIDEFECEPYVYPQNILGDEHPLFGSARNSWLSGTASWIYQAATQYILGVRSEYDGLRVDPCIPSNWDAFEVARNFRGARYTIIVKNPKHVCKGVRELKVNGKVLKGSLIPLQERGEVLVEVTLG
jgi:cellobiose phosphorylase